MKYFNWGKIERMVGGLGIMVGLTLGAPALGMTSLSIAKIQCPDKFVGTVAKIEESIGPENANSKINVSFQVEQTLKGSPGRAPEISVLKFGPYRFIRGETFEIELRDNFICSVKKLDLPYTVVVQ